MCKEYYQLEGFIIFSEICLKGLINRVKKAKKDYKEDIYDTGNKMKYLTLKGERDRLIKVINVARKSKLLVKDIINN